MTQGLEPRLDGSIPRSAHALAGGAGEVWQCALNGLDREEHVYYVGGRYEGAVNRSEDAWSWCLAGRGRLGFTEVEGLESGMAAVEAAVAGRERRDCIPPAPSKSAAPLPGAGPPLRAAVPLAHRGPTAEDVASARQCLRTALAQVAPSDDGIIVGHMRDAFRLLGGRL